MSGIAQLEREIQREIVADLRTLGFDVVVTSQTRRTTVTKGTPDLYIRHRGRQLRGWLETKTPTGKLSAEQLEFMRREREAGGFAEVVRSRADVLDFARRCGVLAAQPGQRRRG